MREESSAIALREETEIGYESNQTVTQEEAEKATQLAAQKAKEATKEVKLLANQTKEKEKVNQLQAQKETEKGIRVTAPKHWAEIVSPPLSRQESPSESARDRGQMR